MIKVKVFVDYPNFSSSVSSRAGSRQVRPQLLQFREMITPQLKGLLGAGYDLRSVNFYGSCPESAANDEDELSWMRDRLDAVQGHNVYILRRHSVEQVCEGGHDTSREKERGVDTLIVSDLVRLAMNGLYDVAVLATNDADLIPAVEMLQSRLDRQVVHLGFANECPAIRAACWGHIDLRIAAPGNHESRTSTPPTPESETNEPRAKKRRHRSRRSRADG